MNDLVKISPEGLEVANTYLATGSISQTAKLLCVPELEISTYLNRREVKKYVDQVFMDQGYRNRNKLFSLLDDIIDQKVQEAVESETYSKKDIVEIIALMHKMRMEEIKANNTPDAGDPKPKSMPSGSLESTDEYGGGNYGKLLRTLLT